MFTSQLVHDDLTMTPATLYAGAILHLAVVQLSGRKGYLSFIKP